MGKKSSHPANYIERKLKDGCTRSSSMVVAAGCRCRVTGSNFLKMAAFLFKALSTDWQELARHANERQCNAACIAPLQDNPASVMLVLVTFCPFKEIVSQKGQCFIILYKVLL